MNIQFLLKRLCILMKLTALCLNMSILANDDDDESTCNFGDLLCSIMCKAMGYSHAICNWDGCTCFHYYQLIGESDRCQLSCDSLCTLTRNGDNGACDYKGNCHCYLDVESKEIEKQQCLLTDKFCRWKCWNIGRTDSYCVGENCICHNDGANATMLDYKNGYCVLPREYCNGRCHNASFLGGGHCHHSDCVCTENNALYFFINLDDIDTLCEACRHYCEDVKVAKGTCVDGDCICINGNWFEIAQLDKNNNAVFGFVKDHCMKICAERNFHKKAISTGFSTCSCGQEAGGSVEVELRDLEEKPYWRKSKAYT